MFKKNKIKIIQILSIAFLSAGFFSLIFGTNIANACSNGGSNTVYCLLAPIPGLTGNSDGSIDVTTGFGDYANRIIRIFIGILGVMAVAQVVFGGIQYMISESGGEKNAGKDRITNAIFGLILALSTYMILNTLNPKLVNLGISVPAATLTINHDDDALAEAETQDGSDYAPVTVTPTGEAPQAICRDYASCKALCTSTNNGASYNGIPHAPGVLDPSLAKPIVGIPLVTATCTNCTAAPGVITALKNLKPSVDNLIASGSIPNRAYTFIVASAYRPVKDQIRLMCSDGDTSINKTVVGHSIAFPGTSKHGIGYAVDFNFFWDGKKTINCGSARDEGAIEKIMIKAGFARLKKEAWHFEIDTSNPNTCGVGSACSAPTLCKP